MLDVVRSAISELIPANHILNTVIKIDTTIKKTYLEVRGERLLHHHLRPLETHREDVPALSVKLFIRAGVRGRSGKSRDRRFLRRWGEADMGYPEMKMMNRNKDIESQMKTRKKTKISFKSGKWCFELVSRAHRQVI